MKFVGGSVNTFGNRNRANPNNHNTCVTASDVKPTASGVPNNTERNPRRSLTFSGSVASTGRFGIGGTSSLGLTAAGFSSVVSNVFGPRCTGLRAAAKILDVSRGPTGASGSAASLAAATGAAGFGFAAFGFAAAGFAPPPPPRAGPAAWAPGTPRARSRAPRAPATPRARTQRARRRSPSRGPPPPPGSRPPARGRPVASGARPRRKPPIGSSARSETRRNRSRRARGGDRASSAGPGGEARVR